MSNYYGSSSPGMGGTKFPSPKKPGKKTGWWILLGVIALGVLFAVLWGFGIIKIKAKVKTTCTMVPGGTGKEKDCLCARGTECVSGVCESSVIAAQAGLGGIPAGFTGYCT